MTPDLKTFLGLAQHITARTTVIPVWKPVLADLLTPSAAYLRLARRARHAFLLESIEGGERVARYTFLGADPHLILRARGEDIEIWERGKTTRRKGKVLDTLRELVARAPLHLDLGRGALGPGERRGREAAPGARFWTTMSACSRTRRWRIACASGCFTSSVRLSLLRLVQTKWEARPCTRSS